MDPQTQFCHNPACPASGLAGQGHIRIHSRKQQRYQCKRCRQTFTARKDTATYRLRTEVAVVALVVNLLTHGCPVPAIVAAFGLDERTVAAWMARAGQHAQAVHEHLVQQGHLDLGHVQADEIWVKCQGRKLWMALALAVPTRLWLGGEVSAQRDGALITRLIQRVRACALVTTLLICVDGLRSYVTAVRQVFRRPVYTGRPGRPRLVAEAGVLLGQMIKHTVQRQVVAVEQRIVQGTAGAIRRVLAETGTGSGINTAYIERLNATFRGALAPLARRSRRLLARPQQLSAAMWLVGGLYNFCWQHRALQQIGVVAGHLQRIGQTPAMAAGLTDHCWSVAEFLCYPVPPPPWIPPKRRGRPPKPARAAGAA
jgi:transposase-like protein